MMMCAKCGRQFFSLKYAELCDKCDSRAAYFMKESDEWGTPVKLFRELDEEFDFTLDPCAAKDRLLKKGMKTHNIDDNGLWFSWEDERVFVNPPYQFIDKWVNKCHMESRRAKVIVTLIPSRTDTKYFHDHIYHIADLRFIKGRLKFVDHSGKKMGPAPFPSLLCIYPRGYKRRNDHILYGEG